jgi:large subunit ribosomal protein L4
MAKINVLNAKATVLGYAKVPDTIFGIAAETVHANIPAMHQVVVSQLAAARQGTHKVKTRAEVRGGGKKPYRQKGTGRARQGSIRAPQYRGGGVTHGPVPRDYSQRTTKRLKAFALYNSLSDRTNENKVFVLNEFKAEIPSTHYAVDILNTITGKDKTLIALSRNDDMFLLSLRNVPSYTIVYADQLSAYDVLLNEAVLFTTDSLKEFLEFRAPDDYEIKIDESLDDETKDEVTEGTAKHPKEFIEVEEDEEAKPKRRAKKDASADLSSPVSQSETSGDLGSDSVQQDSQTSPAETGNDNSEPDSKPKRTRAKKADEKPADDAKVDAEAEAKPKTRKPRKTKADADAESSKADDVKPKTKTRKTTKKTDASKESVVKEEQDV